MGSEPTPHPPAAVLKTNLNIDPRIGSRRHTYTRHLIDFNTPRYVIFWENMFMMTSCYAATA